MPRVAETTDEVYLVSWSKSIGDQVEMGESLLEVETDKATVQIPSPVSGILKEQLFRDGEEISTGDKIASLESD